MPKNVEHRIAYTSQDGRVSVIHLDQAQRTPAESDAEFLLRMGLPAVPPDATSLALLEGRKVLMRVETPWKALRRPTPVPPPPTAQPEMAVYEPPEPKLEETLLLPEAPMTPIERGQDTYSLQELLANADKPDTPLPPMPAVPGVSQAAYEQQVRYEVALMARNKNLDAMRNMQPEAAARGMTVEALADMIIDERRAEEQRAFQSGDRE